MTSTTRPDLEQHVAEPIWNRPIPLPFSLRSPDWTRLFRNTSLPAPIVDLVRNTIRRTRLWRSEKRDVARELIAHFTDALLSVSPEQAIADFGDIRAASRLIRVSKRRNRPLWWKAWHRGMQAFAAILLLALAVYLFAAVLAFSASPKVNRNYIGELNAKSAATPESERAWPIYKQAYLQLPRMPEEITKQFPAIKPEDANWAIATAYIDQCRASLDLIRAAAAKPELGAMLSDGSDIEMYEKSFWLAGQPKPTEPPQPASANPRVISILLPHLGQMRSYARHLKLDLDFSAKTGDSKRALDDLQAMHRMSRQLMGRGVLISELVAIAISSFADQSIRELLTTNPSLLTDAQLASLAHVISAPPTPIRVSFDVERYFMDDVLQRCFTDDGNGDGHLTAAGVREMMAMSGSDRVEMNEPLIQKAATPVYCLISASRRELHDVYYGLIDRAQSQAALHPWERPESDPTIDYVNRIESNAIQRARHLFVSMLIPAFNKAVHSADQCEQTRGATLVAIALELHRRRTGSFPATLRDIPTTILPAIPPDIFDGRPLRYVVENGQPVVYSIGTDRIDDGGRAPKSSGAFLGQWKSKAAVAEALREHNTDGISGDWILFAPGRTATTDK
jgi:hypothetical protein